MSWPLGFSIGAVTWLFPNNLWPLPASATWKRETYLGTFGPAESSAPSLENYAEKGVVEGKDLEQI